MLQCSLHSIYIICIIYRLTGCEVISNFHVQGYKFGGKMENYVRKYFKKLSSAELVELAFCNSVLGRGAAIPTQVKNVIACVFSPFSLQIFGG